MSAEFEGVHYFTSETDALKFARKHKVNGRSRTGAVSEPVSPEVFEHDSPANTPSGRRHRARRRPDSERTPEKSATAEDGKEPEEDVDSAVKKEKKPKVTWKRLEKMGWEMQQLTSDDGVEDAFCRPGVDISSVPTAFYSSLMHTHYDVSRSRQ